MTVVLHLLATTTVLMLTACSKGSDSSSNPGTPTPPTTGAPTAAAFTVTFAESPVPYRTGGCSFSTPQGYFTEARIQERGGVAFTPATLTQRLNGSTASNLVESFGSRFGACSGSAFTPGVIPANGSVCGIVGVCTTSTFTSYQFTVSGTDANGRSVSFDSPVLQLTR